jgi:hypothetical protein
MLAVLNELAERRDAPAPVAVSARILRRYLGRQFATEGRLP